MAPKGNHPLAFTMLTTEPGLDVKPYHDRQIVVLQPEDWRAAPFTHSGYFSDLQLEHVEIIKVSDPCWQEFERSGDKLEFARRHANMTRAWSGPVIASLIEPSRNKVELVGELFDRHRKPNGKEARP